MSAARPEPGPAPRAAAGSWLIRVVALVVVALLIAGIVFAVTRRNGKPQSGAGVTPARRTGPGPNIVLINTDDQRWDELANMPNIQSLLVRHGITFSNYFVTTPSCCPSRSSLLTGQYSHHTGVYDGGSGPHSGAPAFHDASTLATWLHAAGYRTALVGKYLNNYSELPKGYIPPGWDEWDAIAQPVHEDLYYGYTLNENGKLVHYGKTKSDYSTTVLSGLAQRFIDTSTQPFFLYFTPVTPHVPSTPAPGDGNKFANLPPWDPPSFNQPDVSAEPWGRDVRLMSPHKVRLVQSIRRRMLASLLAVDRSVGAFVHSLQERGMLNDTYIFYTSDNGYLWGEHRQAGKIWPFDESIRDPLVVRPPGGVAPTTDAHLVLNIDLASTIAQLAGTRPGLPQDGRSLVPLLRGRSPP